MPASVPVIVYFVIPLVAFLYAAVGHGGASGYIALLTLSGFAPDHIKPTALILNIAVSLLAFTSYYRAGHFRLSLFLPFAAGSVPAAFAGGMIKADTYLLKWILGGILILAAIRMFLPEGKDEKANQPPPVWIAIACGMAIGFVSGLTGIGGGVVLSPLVLLMHWAGMKQTAALSAAFIFVNSVSGLLGSGTGELPTDAGLQLMLILAIAGGIAGSQAGSRKLATPLLKQLLGTGLLIASVKLFL